MILGSHPEWAPNVRLGVSTNYNKLCGMGACQNPSPAQKAAVQALYNAVDFVGLSSYPRFKNAVSDMEDATEIFNYEMLVRAQDRLLLFVVFAVVRLMMTAASRRCGSIYRSLLYNC